MTVTFRYNRMTFRYTWSPAVVVTAFLFARSGENRFGHPPLGRPTRVTRARGRRLLWLRDHSSSVTDGRVRRRVGVRLLMGLVIRTLTYDSDKLVLRLI